MQTTLSCIPCLIKQGIKITNFLNIDNSKNEEMIREILNLLKDEDYKNTPPYLAKKVYSIICKFTETDDPYKKIKEHYNKEILEMRKDLKIILNKLEEVHKKSLKMDNSIEMYEKLKKSKNLLYLGDNCGEIVLDKIFIEYIKNIFPNLNIFYGVRGKPIINDVTLEDAKMVKMEEVAKVLDNGDGAPGTVIKDVKDEFRKLFYTSDIIIAKGQGNYETLSGIDRNHVYMLFMAKCDVIADKIGVKPMSLICMKNINNESIS